MVKNISKKIINNSLFTFFKNKKLFYNSISIISHRKCIIFILFLLTDFENSNDPHGYHNTSEQHAGIEQCCSVHILKNCRIIK